MKIGEKMCFGGEIWRENMHNCVYVHYCDLKLALKCDLGMFFVRLTQLEVNIRYFCLLSVTLSIPTMACVFSA